MTRSTQRQDPFVMMADRWLREADGYEHTAERTGPYTKHERDILMTQARAKRACARELLDETRKVRRG